MARRLRTTIWCLAAAVLSAACGSGGDAAPAGDCTPDTKQPCTCTGGGTGMQTCQLDKTYGVCSCPPPGAAGAPAISRPAASGSSAAPRASAAPAAASPPAEPAPGAAPAPPAGGLPQPVDTPVTAAPPEPVIVPPEDVAACQGMGAAPSADEAVEVLQIRTSDAVPGGFTPPGASYYGCFWVEIDMPEKAHIIGWEGAVGGDRSIHHQQVSLGQKPAYLAQQGGLCGLPSIEYTWTGERPPEWTPGFAGYPIGGPENGGKARFLWQVHFEGMSAYSGGFNAYITKKLRKYDAGNFEQGDVRGINIAPKAKATHEARCTPEMTTQKLSHPIYVFASMEHAHMTVKHIKGQQFRNGMLINTFGDETVMGFAGFFDQSFKPHTPCIEILPGDELITTCEYENPWDQPVTGGEAQNQEMCTTFMQYFPRLPKASDNFCGTIDSSGGFTQP